MKKTFWSLIAAALLLPACQSPANEDISIYLVRHAEKTKGENPGLTEAGLIRAQALRDRLKDKNISHIHSSNYRRTLETAAPLAQALGLEVQIYDPRDLLGIAETVKAAPGAHLVVGHSNTTPELAALISRQIMDMMTETEYDRFIEIRLNKDGELIDHKIGRYGAENR